MLNKDVIFFTFLFSQMNSSPVARMPVDASMKGSSPVSSSLSDLTSVKVLSYLRMGWPASLFFSQFPYWEEGCGLVGREMICWQEVGLPIIGQLNHGD